MDDLALRSEGLHPRWNGTDLFVRKLSIGILAQAFRDLMPKLPLTGASAVWQRDARDWFRSESRAPGSYYWTCEILELDADRLRGTALQYSQARGQKRKAIRNRLRRLQICSVTRAREAELSQRTHPK